MQQVNQAIDNEHAAFQTQKAMEEQYEAGQDVLSHVAESHTEPQLPEDVQDVYDEASTPDPEEAEQVAN